MSAVRHRGASVTPGARKGYCQVRFLHSLASRRRDEEQGFTLIELMVVVLIIAILIAIAIPTFLGARQRAQDRAAQSDLRNGLTAEKTVYTDNQAYDATTATMKAIESSLNWNGATAGRPALTVTTGTTVTADDTVCLSETSKSGTVFNLADVGAGASAGTFYNKGGACTTVAATLSGAWNTGW
jgi:type IV pilus assembly protein PilA